MCIGLCLTLCPEIRLCKRCGIVILAGIFSCDGYSCRLDLELSVLGLDCELFCYVISISILNDCCSVDSVGLVAYVDA